MRLKLTDAIAALGTESFRETLGGALATGMGFVDASAVRLDVLSEADIGDAIRVDAIVSYTEVKAGCQATFEPHLVRYEIQIRKSDGWATVSEVEHRSHWGQ